MCRILTLKRDLLLDNGFNENIMCKGIRVINIRVTHIGFGSYTDNNNRVFAVLDRAYSKYRLPTYLTLSSVKVYV